jgi:hypothetical protein
VFLFQRPATSGNVRISNSDSLPGVCFRLFVPTSADQSGTRMARFQHKGDFYNEYPCTHRCTHRCLHRPGTFDWRGCVGAARVAKVTHIRTAEAQFAPMRFSGIQAWRVAQVSSATFSFSLPEGRFAIQFAAPPSGQCVRLVVRERMQPTARQRKEEQ